MKSAIVFGDRHGHDWKVDPDEYNWVIFLGDYVDSHHINWKQQYTNLAKLIRLKRSYKNVILLIGNHDYQYLNLDPAFRCSEFQENRYLAYHALFRDNEELFQYAFQIEDYIFTHAGISKTFLDSIRVRTGLFHNIKTFADDFNKYAIQLPETFMVSPINGGHDLFDGPLWIRPDQLMNDLPNENIFQVVGHTHVNNIPKKLLDQNIVKFCDNESYGNSFHEFKFL